MIKLLDILKEIQSIDSYELHDRIVKYRDKVQKFFKKNKARLAKYVEKDDWDSFYQIAFDAFPNEPQDDIAQAMGNEANAAGWYTSVSPRKFIGKTEVTKPSKEINQLSDVTEINSIVSDWVRKNKRKLIKLADDDNYKEFYRLVKSKFPEAPEDKLVYAMNKAAVEHGIHYELITEV